MIQEKKKYYELLKNKKWMKSEVINIFKEDITDDLKKKNRKIPTTI